MTSSLSLCSSPRQQAGRGPRQRIKKGAGLSGEGSVSQQGLRLSLRGTFLRRRQEQGMPRLHFPAHTQYGNFSLLSAHANSLVTGEVTPPPSPLLISERSLKHSVWNHVNLENSGVRVQTEELIPSPCLSGAASLAASGLLWGSWGGSAWVNPQGVWQLPSCSSLKTNPSSNARSPGELQQGPSMAASWDLASLPLRSPC